MSAENIDFTSTKTILGFCGLDCGACKVYIATKNDSVEMRRAVAEEWSKASGRVLRAEDMNCVGCVTADGSHYGACALCEIRVCGLEKKVENCGLCIDYHDYHAVSWRVFMRYSPAAKERLEKTRKQTDR